MGNRVFSVTEVNQLVKMSVESAPLLKSLEVRGEVVAAKCYRSRNSTWFTVKDADSELSCVYWGISDIKEGNEVEISGRLTVWTAKGKYQFSASAVRILGDGLEKEALKKLVAELERKGYFDPRNKKALPAVIRTVALVTSEQGAAIGDVLSTLETRGSLARIEVHGVSVQGMSAPAEIAAAIERINRAEREADVILLTRGGGGKEDLSVFNDPLCFESVYHSRIPVICAIGHERDLSIAEKCSDWMCITPTDAANVIVERSSGAMFLAAAFELFRQISDRTKRRLSAAEQELSRIRPFSPAEMILRTKMNLNELAAGIKRNAEQMFRLKSAKLEALGYQIEASSPFSILDRGYALVYKDGKIVNWADTARGDSVDIVMKHGRIKAEVKEVLSEDIRTKIG